MSVRFLTGLITLLVIAGCTVSKPKEESLTRYKPDVAQGKGIYLARCASCHDSGKAGAPSIREPEEWDVQKLAQTGILDHHKLKNLIGLSPNGLPLSGHAEADVLAYIMEEVVESDTRY
jgi:cytochrome c5